MASKLSNLFTAIVVAGGVSFLSGAYLYSPKSKFMEGSLETNLKQAENTYSDLTNQIAQAYRLPYDSKKLESQFGNASEGQEAYVDLLVQKLEIVEKDIADMKSTKNSAHYKKEHRSREGFLAMLGILGLGALGVGVLGKCLVSSSEYDRSKEFPHKKESPEDFVENG